MQTIKESEGKYEALIEGMGDTVMVKRLAAAGPGRMTLLSQNLAYPPVEVALDDITVIGRVVWKGGRV